MSQSTLLVFPDNERWKNAFSFDHAMEHRKLMSVMGPLTQWSTMPYFIDPMKYDGRPSTMWHMLHEQAHTDFTSYLPAYANVPPPAGVALVGPISAVHLVSGGSGYTSPVFTISGTGSGATFHWTLGAGGVITALSVVNGGSGYATTDTLTISNNPPTVGTGAHATLSVNVTNIAAIAPNGSISGVGIPGAQNLVDVDFQRQDSQPWWTFANHQEHLIASNAIVHDRQAATVPWWTLPPRQVQVFW